MTDSTSRSPSPRASPRLRRADSTAHANRKGGFSNFDATAHAEYLYHCVAVTVRQDLPAELAWLQSYDWFTAEAQRRVDMPARMLDLLHRFLRQNDGRLSKRARTDEFAALSPEETERIEALYAQSIERFTL